MSTTAVAIPVFQPLSEEMSECIRVASRAEVDETDEADGFARLVDKISAAGDPASVTILIPEGGPGRLESETFSALSRGAFCFCKVQGMPGARSTYGVCSDYSEGYGVRPIPIGTLIRFHTPDFFLVAKSFLLDATSSAVVILGEKRAHGEMSAIGGIISRQVRKICHG